MVRRITLCFCLLIHLAGFGQNQSSKMADRILIYYFHGSPRCSTCIAIETNTKRTLDTYFKKEVENKTIQFLVIDISDSKNERLVRKYEAAGSAMHLVKITNGKEKDEDLTNFAFSYAKNNPEKFIIGLKDKISR